MSEKYYGNYLGIVVSPPSWDPERRNRVQIWIPSISNTLYKDWNNAGIDRQFFNLNNSTSPRIEVLERIRGSLPWAECASPLIGGGSPFYTNPIDTKNFDPNPENVVEQPTQGTDDLAADFSMRLPDIPTGEPSVASDLDVSPEEPSPLLNNASQTSINNSLAEASTDTEVDEFGNVEPALPEGGTFTVEPQEDDPVPVRPSSQAGSPQGLVKPPSESQPDFPVRNQDYFIRSGVAPNDRLLKDVYNTAKSVFPNGVIINVTSGARNNSTRHRNGNAVDFYVQAKNDSGQFVTVTGDALAPLVQAWVAQGNAAGIYMKTRVGGDKSGLHFDQTDNNVWTYSGRVVNGRNEDVGLSSSTGLSRIGEGSAMDNAIKNGKLRKFPDSVDPTVLVASSEKSSQPNQRVNDWAEANAASQTGSYDGSATGTFSTVNVGAKVWVFFYGGDVQKPIYFAQSLDSASTAQAFQNLQIV